MLLQIAIADAYGAGFEYTTSEFLQSQNDLTRYVKHPKHNLPLGSYTDDTQMSLALAEVIADGRDWTREVIAEAFVTAFKRDQREGYAQGFYNFLTSVNNGAEFLEHIKPDSDKSGAAMRAAPVGVFKDIDVVKARCELQARLTHDTTDGVNAALAASLAAHYFLYQLGSKADLGSFLEKQVPGEWNKRWQGKVGQKGWMSVRAAITAIMDNSTLSGLLKSCVAFEGDVDTVAAIALGAASQSSEYTADLPAALHDGLENGTYGRDYLKSLDSRLTTLYAAH